MEACRRAKKRSERFKSNKPTKASIKLEGKRDLLRMYEKVAELGLMKMVTFIDHPRKPQPEKRKSDFRG